MPKLKKTTPNLRIRYRADRWSLKAMISGGGRRWSNLDFETSKSKFGPILTKLCQLSQEMINFLKKNYVR